jgi:hypothetical protein
VTAVFERVRQFLTGKPADEHASGADMIRFFDSPNAVDTTGMFDDRGCPITAKGHPLTIATGPMAGRELL